MGICASVLRQKKAAEFKLCTDLAAVEYQKGNMAVQLGLYDEAIVRYRNMESLLLKAYSCTTTLPFLSWSEQNQVKALQDQIVIVLASVSEMLQLLYRRPAGGVAPMKLPPNININHNGGGGGGGGGGGNGGDGSIQMVYMHNSYNFYVN
ncbi:uncharacterized protein A4U43_C09F4490 [Asparagus officinalis]|uniref:Uncharacterized protein n=1 Tax=Asparagus officinalis TaxID=4686 RepID=A0A5P1E5A5_ASPOF|nr:uncharacterized protein LOC109823168 [Asparagus officinalis]ONK57821.1 uncharacterized protein A4U43_C09F4490 [Asparagus officinalis]